MADTKAFLLFLLGMVLRLGIPLVVTIGVIVLLRRLDQRWQKESQVVPVVPMGKPCWEIKGCSKEKVKGCAAAANPQIPCWQVFRSREGFLREQCIGCETFRKAPVPANSLMEA